MCGYDMHQFNHDGVVWERKYDNGFILADGTQVRGKVLLCCKVSENA